MSLEQTELNELLKDIVKESILDIRTTTIGKITKVNTNTINVQPVISANVQGRTVNLPEFIDVPIFTLQGGSSYIAMPLAVDDYCILMICERNIDNWWLGEDLKPPREYQIHDYSNTIALVGLNNSKNPISIPDVIKIVGDVQHNGLMEHIGNTQQLGNYSVQGDVTVTGLTQTITLSVGGDSPSTSNVSNTTLELDASSDIVIDGVSLKDFIENHTHGGVTAGGSNTDTPNPL